MIPDLFLLGGIDVGAGLLLLSLKAPIYKIVAYSLTPEIVFLLALAIILKGVYSIAYGLVAS